MTCSVEGCDRPDRYKGLCSMHYKRQWRHGDPTIALITNKYKATDVCLTEGCTNKPRSKGLCNGCRIRLFRKGTTERSIAKKGTGRPKTSAGYVLLTIDGKRIYEHRHVMELKLGRKLLPEEVVHHKEDVEVDQNHPEHLELFSSQSEHMKHHAMLKATKRGE